MDQRLNLSLPFPCLVAVTEVLGEGGERSRKGRKEEEREGKRGKNEKNGIEEGRRGGRRVRKWEIIT